MNDHPKHTPRIGTFFLLLGFVSLLLFLCSGFSRQPAFSFLFLSLVTFLIGYLFRRRAERPSSGRFRIIQEVRKRWDQSKEEDPDKDKKGT